MMLVDSDNEAFFPEEHLEILDEETSSSIDAPAAVAAKKRASQSGKTYQAEELAEGTAVVDKPLKRKWYIIHTYSGHENKVKFNLDRRIESMGMGHKIFRVEVPQKPVTKIKDGKRIEKEEHLFPGYVLVEMMMDDDSWYCVRYTPGVTKFVGGEKKPIPARESEIKRILGHASTNVVAKIEVDLHVDDHIQIISGPFTDFEGTITEVMPEKEKLRAVVSIFGRETPVELMFNQVQKRLV
ncbi:MAG: transcription termination/antitermination protein NusG [Vampirovibrionales bacterium]